MMEETKKIERRTTDAQQTILIVEDNPDSRELLAIALRAEGYNVIEAENGKYAILEASKEHPDLIVMDLILPAMDGVEATRRILSVPKLADTPIYAVTAYAIDEVEKDALSAGCRAVLEKPVDLDVLLTKIREALGGKTGSHRQPRTVLRVPVSISVNWGLSIECPHVGTITSLSSKGCLIHTNLVLPLSSKVIYLRFRLPDGKLMSLQGGVLYYLRKVGFGLEFRDLSEEDEAALKKIVSTKTLLK